MRIFLVIGFQVNCSDRAAPVQVILVDGQYVDVMNDKTREVGRFIRCHKPNILRQASIELTSIRLELST